MVLDVSSQLTLANKKTEINLYFLCQDPSTVKVISFGKITISLIAIGLNTPIFHDNLQVVIGQFVFGQLNNRIALGRLCLIFSSEG